LAAKRFPPSPTPLATRWRLAPHVTCLAVCGKVRPPISLSFFRVG